MTEKEHKRKEATPLPDQDEADVTFEYARRHDISEIIDLVCKVQIETFAGVADGVTKEVLEETYDDMYRNQTRVMLNDIISDPKAGTVRIARKAGEIIGTCFTGINEHDEREIFALYVQRNEQGHGTGSELLADALDWHTRHGAEHDDIYLEVVKKTPAFQFYRKRGFVGVKSENHDLKGDITLPLIKMSLSHEKRDAFLASMTNSSPK